MFSFGCFLMYRLLKDHQEWDSFWERENRQNPIAPENWSGSDASKLMSYLFAILFFFGGLFVLIQSAFKLLMFITT